MESPERPDLALPPGSATGVGSVPGTAPLEAVKAVFGLLPDLPFLPELPARGPGADMVGRAVSLLADLHGDVQPSGWRLTPGPGRDERLGVAWLGEDLDALEEVAGAHEGAVKLQVTGPVTLAATVELFRGGLAARDPGARRDLTESLAEGVAAHVAEVRRRLPAARVVLQLDEPALPTALLGRLPTASGFGALRALEESEAQSSLEAVVAAAGVPVVLHCCAASPPVALFRRAGAWGVSLDASLLTERDDEVLGEAVDAGVQLLLGLVPSMDSTLSDVAATVAPVRRLWRRLGFAPGLLATAVTVTPTCGLAGASAGYARLALERCAAAGRALVDDPEG
ncbi:cobalamin-independent methionine synthase catalytic subunit [Motilibacter peucedani]|uniref:Cobalamin-independent methionine synthase catalytic subunit n=1 Tax=Motilibacter peucedani TaxID=598650 RepID=A0A420XLJ8_9ACTN|nr:methionine synthase [Motilibacter peucedani]RKS71293.1 cobalamin-independent methionine synthase catalytic subunit [Motilibacter peucedani]